MSKGGIYAMSLTKPIDKPQHALFIFKLIQHEIYKSKDI